MNNTENRSGFDIVSDVETAIVGLSALPRVIYTLIDYLKLDMEDWTKDDELNFCLKRHTVYDTLVLTQDMIYKTVEELNKIHYKKSPESTTTETTK